MARFERQHVSKLVPGDRKILTALLVVVAVVNSATLGFDGAVMNGLLILPSYTEYFSLDTTTIGLNSAAVWMGQILGCFIMQPVADYLGRKKSILVASLITFVGIILQAAAQNIGMFVVARIIVGIGISISNASAPTLLAELLPARIRGCVLGVFFSCYYFGSLIASIVSFGSQNIQSTWSWRLPSLLQLIPSAVALSLLPFVPESPRWLISKGQSEHAQEVLAVMKGGEMVDMDEAAFELREIRAVMAREEEEYPRNAWREIASTPGNRKRLFVLVAFGIMLNTFGNFIISFYLSILLDQAGITNTNSQLQINVGISCWCFVVSLVGSFMLDIIGRRKQTLGSIGGMIVTLYIIGALIKTYGSSSDSSGIYGTIAVIFLFQGFYSFAITPMTSVYPTELAQYKVRAAGIAVFRFFDAGFGLLCSFAMSYAMADLNWKFYLVNASWNVVFLAIVYFYFPETKGVKLEEIAAFFDGQEFIDAALAEEDSIHEVKEKRGPNVIAEQQ